MTCVQADNLLQHGLDGRLSASQRAALDDHLAGCAACRAASDEYRALAQTAAQWARESALPDDGGGAFMDAVMAQIAAAQGVPPPRWTRQMRVLTLCGVLVLAALSVLAGPHLPMFPVSILRTGLTPTHLFFSVDGLVRILTHAPTEVLGVWDTLTARPAAPSRWMWSALALTLGLNTFFVWRARRQNLRMAQP